MNKVKNRLAALSLLDRAFGQWTDDQIGAVLESMEADAVAAVDHIIGLRDTDDASRRVEAIRSTATKGRINGDLERLALLLTDACLADCIEKLGDDADNPSEARLAEVLPGVVERHGLATTQVMMASVVAGEALASPIITRMLKTDDQFKLPAVTPRPVAPAPAAPADDAERDRLRAERKQRRKAEQDEARARREQSAAARRKK